MVYLDMSCFAKSKIGSFCEYGIYLDGFGQAEGLFPEPVFSSSETTLDGCGTMYVYGFCLWLVGKEWVWGGKYANEIFSFDGCKGLGGSVRWIQRNVAGKLF